MRSGGLGREWWHAVGSHGGHTTEEKGGVLRLGRRAHGQYGLLTSHFLSYIAEKKIAAMFSDKKIFYIMISNKF